MDYYQDEVPASELLHTVLPVLPVLPVLQVHSLLKFLV